MNKEVLWAWVVTNSVALIAWVTIAIVFDKWWLALFAVLFISGLRTVHKSYRVCDKCGKHSPYADSYNEALEMAKEAGWVHIVDNNMDYCPDCFINNEFSRGD